MSRSVLIQLYLFNRVLRRFAGVNKSTIHVLLTLSLIGGKDRFISIKSIRKGLLNVCRGDDYRKVRSWLLACCDRGLLIRNTTVRKTEWFKLSVEGMNLLHEFEAALKKERLPKF